MFVSRWNQTQVHAEGGPPSARCPRDARWVLGDRNCVQKEVGSSTCNFGTTSEVLSRGFFHTLSSSGIFFSRHLTALHRPQVRQGRGLLGTALPRDARSLHGDRGFGWNDDNFLLFGVTTCPVSHLLPRGGAGTFVSGRDANVVRETVIATRWLSCLRARRPMDICGHPPSLGSCVRRVRGIPYRPRRHPRCSRSARRGRVRLVVRARRSPPLLFRRFMRRVDRRVRSRGSGCPVHKKQLLPVLVVWAPPRKKRAARPQWEHVGLGCELLLRDDPRHRVEETH